MNKTKFEGLIVRLASVEDIEKWSHGVVDNPDTVNYRTGKPKQWGLFCESIFWPVKNYECSCGKYKWVRYKWIVCERCGVEVTTSRVRRSRMWHIELAVPLLHIWYKSSPSWWVNQLLGISANEIDKILSFVKYIMVQKVDKDFEKKIKEKIKEDFDVKTKELEQLYKSELEKDNGPDKSKESQKKLKELEKLFTDNKDSLEKEFNRIKSIIADLEVWSTIFENDFRNIFARFSHLIVFQSGPEAILRLLQNIDVEKDIKKNIQIFKNTKSEEQRKKLIALIKLLINLHVSGVKPENMIIRKLPVIPPDLRPVVQLEWGKFASSDVNLFYRRVLMRNIRLKKMIQVGMPDVVKKNEIRLLQESVNNLLVGEKAWAAWGSGAGIKVFKSLSDMLSGKEGIFRKNLLGKRVDYSGRSIITVGPQLKLDECGLPIYIAVKMFTPFIIGKLIEKKIVYTPKQAEKLIKEESPLALKFLEEVIKDKWVLLNRAPTLHRLSIEAFKIILMPGKTIRIHPLVCPSFNADFDGDQMAIHLPISDEAQREARELIAADKNILKPWSGEPTIAHSQDMVLGVYYLTDFYDHKNPQYTSEEEWQKKPIRGIFPDIETVLNSYANEEIFVKDKIILNYNGEPIETMVGRVIFNSVLPEKIRFINAKLKNKDIKRLLSRIFDECGMQTTVYVADDIKDLWFKYATLGATSVNILDMKVPKEKEEELKIWDNKANEVYKYFFKWFFSEEEKHRFIIKIWTDIKKKIEESLKWITTPGQDLYTMVDSWARWSQTHMTQIAGMKWLVVNPQGEIIELPIKNSFVEWLRPIEYFISAHAGRKGKADTALRTAESWYLTRKLCDASQEVIIREHDCWTDKYVVYSKQESELRGDNFYNLIAGRVLAEDVIDKKKNVILSKDDFLDKENMQLLQDMEIEEVKVRTPLICHSISWICQKCYGTDLSTRRMVEVWVPVGIIAAQSIGEPSTQLTLSTFHEWWVAKWWDPTTLGIDRVKQLFEVRDPKNPAIIAPFDGKVSFYETNKLRYVKVVSEYQKKTYLFKSGYKVDVKKWEEVKKWWIYASKGKSKLKIKEAGKVLEIKADHIILGIQEEYIKTLTGLNAIKKDGEEVFKWEILTNGALAIKEYKNVVGDLEAQKYIIREIKKVYGSQGQDINDRHIEVVVKQLFSKVFIEDSGNSSFIPGTYIKYEEFIKVNKELEADGKKAAKGKRLALGLTNIAKETDSWLSAASFQETIRVMVASSLKGSIDKLSDLKSNVIIGRLLPVGEIYRKDHGIDIQE